MTKFEVSSLTGSVGLTFVQENGEEAFVEVSTAQAEDLAASILRCASVARGNAPAAASL